MADKITYGILGVFILAAAAGAGILLTQEQIDKAFTCTSNNVTGIFESYSKTYITAYWTNATGAAKQSVCTKGMWIPTKQWAEINKIDLKKIEIQPESKIEESVVDEKGREIVSIGTAIVVDKSKSIMIEGKEYNITYKPVIKCICEKATGCKIKECLG